MTEGGSVKTEAKPTSLPTPRPPQVLSPVTAVISAGSPRLAQLFYRFQNKVTPTSALRSAEFTTALFTVERRLSCLGKEERRFNIPELCNTN